MMFFQKRVDLAGSEKTLPPRCERTGDVDGNALTERNGRVAAQRKSTSRRQRSNTACQPSGIQPKRWVPIPKDVQAVEHFAHHHHLSVVETSLEKRRVVLRGTTQQHEQGVWHEASSNTETPPTTQHFRGRSGTLTIPEELQDLVIAVLGLITGSKRVAHFQSEASRQRRPPPHSTPPIVAALYNFPTGVDGTGQTIGIIELGGGYNTADLQTYFQGVGLAVPSVTAVSVDGGANTPGQRCRWRSGTGY